MNASERATTAEVAGKIAATVNAFKAHFPDVRVDLKPWASNRDTRDLVDPDSIDVGFHFPGRSRLCQCRSILAQIRFYSDPVTKTYRVIGLELAGFDHKGKQWQLSTINNWDIIGEVTPVPDVTHKLKLFCQQVFELFNGSTEQAM
ncbi:MAG: hypothetical protein IGR76_10575 [Synechococcales cyanobacterium T60_A2020_003]|nr:hypothetical protein [Synechococcales cyanobacterium T60_A2020_003]